MAGKAGLTTFVPGAAGLIGTELVRVLVARGHPVLAGHLGSDAVFSNIRLRRIGFQFRYPTPEHGLQQVLRALHE